MYAIHGFEFIDRNGGPSFHLALFSCQERIHGAFGDERRGPGEKSGLNHFPAVYVSIK